MYCKSADMWKREFFENMERSGASTGITSIDDFFKTHPAEQFINRFEHHNKESTCLPAYIFERNVVGALADVRRGLLFMLQESENYNQRNAVNNQLFDMIGKLFTKAIEETPVIISEKTPFDTVVRWLQESGIARTFNVVVMEDDSFSHIIGEWCDKFHAFPIYREAKPELTSLFCACVITFICNSTYRSLTNKSFEQWFDVMSRKKNYNISTAQNGILAIEQACRQQTGEEYKHIITLIFALHAHLL